MTSFSPLNYSFLASISLNSPPNQLAYPLHFSNAANRVGNGAKYHGPHYCVKGIVGKVQILSIHLPQVHFHLMSTGSVSGALQHLLAKVNSGYLSICWIEGDVITRANANFKHTTAFHSAPQEPAPSPHDDPLHKSHHVVIVTCRPIPPTLS